MSINVNNLKYRACMQSLQALAVYTQEAAMDPLMSWDRRMEILKWVDKKIPQILRLMIELKTKEINK